MFVIILFTFVLNLFMVDGRVLWQWKFLSITYEGVSRAFFMAVRLVLIIIGSSIMTLTTKPVELTDGLEKLLSPFSKIGLPSHEIALMMTIALRFIPTLMEETDKIMKAQSARGADFDTGSIVDKAKAHRAQLTKKSDAPKGESRAAKENKALAARVLQWMPADHPVLTSEIMEHVNGIMTSQKCTKVMEVLIAAGKARRVEKVKGRYIGYELV